MMLEYAYNRCKEALRRCMEGGPCNDCPYCEACLKDRETPKKMAAAMVEWLEQEIARRDKLLGLMGVKIQKEAAHE